MLQNCKNCCLLSMFCVVLESSQRIEVEWLLKNFPKNFPFSCLESSLSSNLSPSIIRIEWVLKELQGVATQCSNVWCCQKHIRCQCFVCVQGCQNFLSCKCFLLGKLPVDESNSEYSQVSRLWMRIKTCRLDEHHLKNSEIFVLSWKSGKTVSFGWTSFDPSFQLGKA